MVAENHSVIGGLGEAVAGTLLRAGVAPRRFGQIALPDAFLDAGALPTLHDRYGISANAVAREGQALALAVGAANDNRRLHRPGVHGPAHGEEPGRARLPRPGL